MAQKIYKDGTDQYIMTRLGSINNTTGAQGILLGASEGYSLSTLIDNIIVIFSEYKTEDESIAPDIRWNSTAGMWKINIPHENITQLGTSWLNISGQNDSGISIIPTAIEVEAINRMAFDTVIPHGSYAHNATAKTITFESPYDTITVEQILYIRNLTTNYIIYDHTYKNYRTLPIRFSESPYTNVLSYDSEDRNATNGDIIQIIVNMVQP